MFTRTLRDGRKAGQWRFALLALLFAGFLLGPVPMADAAGLDPSPHSQHHSHPAPDGGDASAPSDPSKPHHGMTGCSAMSCAPSFVAAGASAAFSPRPPASLRRTAVNDPLLRSFYLDGDPPVPRS